jgi:cytochrome c oxidase assembly protein subunit 15
VWAGLAAALVNLLILGSALADGNHPHPLLFIPGFLGLAAVLGLAGGVVGSRSPHPIPAGERVGRFARVAVFVTFFLVIAGGVVTTKGAGLDVPDWPSSFGWNMFAFPLSRMTGGIYYEHAHRLLGTLVGLTSLVLLIWLAVADGRRGVKAFAVGTFLLVVVQGLLGGLRVVDLSLALAAVHGVTGQAIFGLFVCLAAFTSRTWRTAPGAAPSPRIGADHKLGIALAVFLLLQIALGAVLRHYDKMMHAHITLAVVVFVLALISGFRAWGFYGEARPLRNAGLALILLAVLQLGLGIAALVARGMHAEHATRGPWTTLVITAHQATGALLVGATALYLVWSRRLFAPERAG